MLLFVDGLASAHARLARAVHRNLGSLLHRLRSSACRFTTPLAALLSTPPGVQAERGLRTPTCAPDLAATLFDAVETSAML